jgi:hypothetical protein
MWGVVMNKKILITTIATLAFSSGLFANEACNETTLHGHMENIKDEMWAMSSDIKSGDNESASGHLDALISLFEKARTETPYKLKTENLDDSELEVQKTEFTAAIDETIEIFKNLDIALQSGDTAEIRKWIGAAGNQRKLGHRAFKADC